MADSDLSPWADVAKRVTNFADSMREQSIHVGMGSNPTCVLCGEPWPCESSKKSEPQSNG